MSDKWKPSIIIASHPAWVRGLKHIPGAVNLALSPSHPAWVRGLKHHQ